MALIVRWALICGSVPLIFAISILVGWMISREDAFLFVGAAGLAPSLILWCAALVLTIAAWWRMGHGKEVTAAAALLIVSVPLAAAMLSYAIITYFSHEITIINKSGRLIRSLIFQDPQGGTHVVSGISPGQRITKSFQFSGEGSVTFRMGEGERSRELLGYITNAQKGSRVVLTIHPDESTSIDVLSED